MPSPSLVVVADTPLHKQLVHAIKARITLAEEYMCKRHTDWEKAEEQFVAYLPDSAANRTRKESRDAGRQDYETLVIPYSYAVLMTAHTYYTSVFLGRNPIFQHIGRHGEADKNVQAIDALIDYQVNQARMLPKFYTWLLDPGKYGFGVLWNYWDTEIDFVSQIITKPEVVNGFTSGASKQERVIQEVKGYEGNKVFNVSPWDFLPDPRVPLQDYQDGEFVGRRTRVSFNEVIRGEKQGKYFNVQKLREINQDRQNFYDREEGSAQIERPSRQDPADSGSGVKQMGFVNLVELVVEILPTEWGLGENDFPEKWVFTLAENELLIGIQPLGAFHNNFPCLVLLQEPESYGLLPESMLGRLHPINNVMDWLVNTHFFNIRSAVNNQFVYDPAAIVERDVMAQTPGKRIRLRPEAYGRDVRTVMQQIPVNDVTRGHLADLNVVYELAQRVTGVTDNIMGMLSPRGRKTATEVRTSSSFGVNRLKTTTEFFSAMGWTMLDQMMLQNTQQYYNDQKKYRIAGDLTGTSDPFIDVSPDSISGFYDFVPVDGTLPVDRFAMATLWQQMFQQMRQFPQLMVGYDLVGMFEMIAQMAGMKSIKQFRVEVQPDSVAAAAAQAGNLVPLRGGASGGTTGGVGGGAAGDDGLEGLTQLTGLGDLA
jgi:hypothetical protein